MCGITGFLNLSKSATLDELQSLVAQMADRIVHRGPDDSGVWCDPAAGIALGFRRLAILDLSPTGRQPMLSADGRYVMVFNGEVYNFAELRAELLALGHGFRGHSDTEVMLAATVQWGPEAAVSRFNGMFAIALWDSRLGRLSLIRDRIGIKPLYYGWAGRSFLFGSQLKALRAHPDFRGEIDRDALALYLRYGYVPESHTIYRGVHKLLPGCILSVEGDAAPESQTIVPFWTAREAVERCRAEPFEGTATEAVEALNALLLESVGLRMIADVPLGAFLSGGVDSSTVVSLMQAQSSRPVKTFTIGFREADFDEASHAAGIARHLGTDHASLYVTPQEARDVIPLLPGLYDEPFADSSQIPTYLVSKLARQEVTVCLSGDGGDELFGGYKHYSWTPATWERFGWIPSDLRRLGAGALDAVPASVWARYLPFARRIFPELGQYPADKILRLNGILLARTPEAIYYDVISQWNHPEALLLGAHEPAMILTEPEKWAKLKSVTERLMFFDLVTYLPDDILAKVDRASMGVSLEARVPFLDDHRVVEFAWRLPLGLKLRGEHGKWILRQLLRKYLPEKLVDRPKQGFSVPVDAWLRGPLRGWVEEHLDADRIRDQGIFQAGPIRQTWAEHLSGDHNWQSRLWSVLMFQAWLSATD